MNIKPVTVYVYLNEPEMWGTTEKMEDMDDCLFQTIQAVPTTDPITFKGDGEEEIMIGDVFCLDEDGTPNMMRVEYFEDPAPEVVFVLKDGCIVNAMSLTGNRDFAYAVIDLDNLETDGEHPIPPTADIYVVDGTVKSLEGALSLLKRLNNEIHKRNK